jgi:hypothetical protein
MSFVGAGGRRPKISFFQGKSQRAVWTSAGGAHYIGPALAGAETFLEGIARAVRPVAHNLMRLRSIAD